MSAIVSGVIGGMIATALGAAAFRSQKAARVDSDGWKRLRPGWYVHLTLFGCLAFVLVMAYFFAEGGSERADADDQNFYALLIMLAFGAGGLWLLWAGYLHSIAWRGTELRYRAPLRGDTYYRLSDITDISGSFDGSECKFHFADGRMLRVSVYFHGFRDLMEELVDCGVLERADED